MRLIYTLLTSMILLASPLAKANDFKLIWVGSPQSGPPMVVLNAFKDNIEVPVQVVSHKDCREQVRYIERQQDVVYMIVNMTMIQHSLQGQDCVPNFKPQDVLGSFVSAWHLCRKPGTADMTPGQRWTFGAPNGMPGRGIVRRLNQYNNLDGVFVPVLSSSQVATMIMNGDLDWGMVNPGMSEPLMQQKKLDCPYTFLPQGTAMVPADRLLSRNFRLETTVDQVATWLVVIKTQDPAKRQAIEQALYGEQFRVWLNQYHFSDLRLSPNPDGRALMQNWRSNMLGMEQQLYR